MEPLKSRNETVRCGDSSTLKSNESMAADLHVHAYTCVHAYSCVRTLMCTGSGGGAARVHDTALNALLPERLHMFAGQIDLWENCKEG